MSYSKMFVKKQNMKPMDTKFFTINFQPYKLLDDNSLDEGIDYWLL